LQVKPKQEQLGVPVVGDSSTPSAFCRVAGPREKFGAYRERIIEARTYAIDCARSSHPNVSEGVNSLIRVVNDAVKDPGLSMLDKSAIVLACVRSLQSIGEANRPYFGVQENVRKGTAMMRDTVEKTELLKGNMTIQNALDDARASVHTSARARSVGGLQRVTKEGLAFHAAWQIYDEYCTLNGKPADEAQVAGAVEWVAERFRKRMKNPLSGGAKTALRDRIRLDVAESAEIPQE